MHRITRPHHSIQAPQTLQFVGLVDASGHIRAEFCPLYMRSHVFEVTLEHLTAIFNDFFRNDLITGNIKLGLTDVGMRQKHKINLLPILNLVNRSSDFTVAFESKFFVSQVVMLTDATLAVRLPNRAYHTNDLLNLYFSTDRDDQYCMVEVNGDVKDALREYLSQSLGYDQHKDDLIVEKNQTQIHGLSWHRAVEHVSFSWGIAALWYIAREFHPVLQAQCR